MRIKKQLLALTIVLGLFSCQEQKSDSSDESVTEQDSIAEIGIDISIKAIERVTKANIRGLYLFSDSIGWASGADGTFLKMTDGDIWKSDTIPGYTHLDFRDVHAFDANTALLMAAGEEGRILRTEDGGVSWAEVYTRLDSGIFLDGMDFHKNIGYCYGDPIDGKFVLIRSEDYGKTWHEIESEKLPEALPKEAGFAASGTGIVTWNGGCWFLTGGDSISRVFSFESDTTLWMLNTDLATGSGCGGFSLARIGRTLVAVGGCYLDSTNSNGNCVVSHPEEGWRLISENEPRGYRSCVAASKSKKLLMTCGRTGSEYSQENGLNWIPLSDEGYYTCSLADSTGWLMGKRGKMAKVSWKSTQK